MAGPALTRRSLLGLALVGMTSLPALGRGPRTLSVVNFLDQLRQRIAPLYLAEHLRHEYALLANRHDLPETEADLRRYIRLRTLFESARAGGLWHLYWTVTNQEPTSKQIWRQWQSARPLERSTARAECDELSALLAFLCRKMAVPAVGLFWPRPNHTVAVWTPSTKHGRQARIVIPTSQIFLAEQETLGTAHWEPYTQRVVYPYQGLDVAPTALLPHWLGEFFLGQIDDYAGATTPMLSAMRTERAAWQDGTLLHAALRPMSRADRQALKRFQLRYR